MQFGRIEVDGRALGAGDGIVEFPRGLFGTAGPKQCVGEKAERVWPEELRTGCTIGGKPAPHCGDPLVDPARDGVRPSLDDHTPGRPIGDLARLGKFTCLARERRGAGCVPEILVNGSRHAGRIGEAQGMAKRAHARSPARIVARRRRDGPRTTEAKPG